MSGISRRVFGGAVAAVLAARGRVWAVEDDDPDDGSFGMSPPIVCKEISGYEDYVPLDPPALTAEDKLLLYILPRHYKTDHTDKVYVSHLTEDGRMRRKGGKGVLWTKEKMVDYKVRTQSPPGRIYLRNTVSLKGLKPGEYEFDVTLRDEIGRSAPATRTVAFQVVPPRASSGGAKKSPDGPESSGPSGPSEST